MASKRKRRKNITVDREEFTVMWNNNYTYLEIAERFDLSRSYVALLRERYDLPHRPRAARTNIPIRKIIQEYEKHGKTMSMTQFSKMMNEPRSTVERVLWREGVSVTKYRKRLTTEQNKEIARFYMFKKGNMTCKQVAEKFNLSESAVQRRVRKFKDQLILEHQQSPQDPGLV